MKIYDSATAPNPRRVRIFLAEKGVEVPYEQVDIVKADNRSAEFRRKNPLGTLPVLELDDGTLHRRERRHLPLLRGAPSRPAADGHRRARPRAWSRCGSAAWSSSCSDRSRRCSATPTRSSPDAFPRSPEWGEVCRKAAEARLAWLDGVLAEREFVAGARYTIADITALCGDRLRPRQQDPHPARADPPGALARGRICPPEREGVGDAYGAAVPRSPLSVWSATPRRVRAGRPAVFGEFARCLREPPPQTDNGERTTARPAGAPAPHIAPDSAA